MQYKYRYMYVRIRNYILECLETKKMSYILPWKHVHMYTSIPIGPTSIDFQASSLWCVKTSLGLGRIVGAIIPQIETSHTVKTAVGITHQFGAIDPPPRLPPWCEFQLIAGGGFRPPLSVSQLARATEHAQFGTTHTVI
jgi:hypothetical protein